MDKISLVLATRNRPNNLRRFYQSLVETSCDMPEVVLYIDNDDKLSIPVAEEFGFKYVVGPRHLLSQCNNEAATLATNDILMFAGDDLIFRVKDWDKRVIEEFNKVSDRILFVHGDDGYHGDVLGTHGFLHKRWIDTVGYFMPPYFATWYVDNWITDIANALGRRIFIPYIIAEHMHHSFGKAVLDTTYTDAESKHGADGQAWSSTQAQRLADIEKLRSAFCA